MALEVSLFFCSEDGVRANGQDLSDAAEDGGAPLVEVGEGCAAEFEGFGL